MKKLYTLFSLLICMFIAGQSIAQVVNVSGDITNDTTWTDTVNVTDHIYIPDTVTLTIQPGTYVQFAGNYGVTVDGNILAQGLVNDSILFTADSSGYSTNSHIGWLGFVFDNTISADSSFFDHCIFTFFKSNSYDSSAIWVMDYGKIVISNSRFSYNYSSSVASCINIFDNGDLIIDNNLFTYNYSNYSAINIGCYSSSSSSVINKTRITNSVFLYNTGISYGSALKISAYSEAIALNNTFMYNYCQDDAGAVQISGFSSPILIGNLIANNHADDMGGGVSIKYYTKPILINNTIVNNSSTGVGGGVQIGCYTTNAILRNNIIWGNEAFANGDQIYIQNEYGNSGFQFSNNIIQDSIYDGYNSVYFELGINTMYNSPLFVDSANGDYHLTCLSPAIDAGSNPTIMMPPTDLDGNQRLIGSNYDIGAYEMLSAAYILSHPQSIQVMTGTVANFTVGASYSTSFQWEESTNFGSTWSALSDNATYSGTTTNSLSINAVYTMNGYMYRCLVGGNCPGAITPSNSALLIVDYNVGISENDNTVMVYPNPSKNNVFVQGAEGADITISDLNGRVIESRYDLGSDKEMISLAEYENGMYILRVIQDENISIIKIIKE
ncbi:MAG: T9SS type A sorting domain-containing protein [Bacteroidales bacterium]|nr:T9SS type A sorting domain-containing protein [Bacteroidales bacterium]